MKGPKAGPFDRFHYHSLPARWRLLEQLRALRKAQLRMTQQSDDLTTEVTELGANLADVSTQIDSEIADLAAASSSTPNPAIDAAVTNLRAANTQLKAMSAALSADNKPATPPAGV